MRSTEDFRIHKGPYYGGPWTEEDITWTSVAWGACDEQSESTGYNLTMWGNANYGGTNWQQTSAYSDRSASLGATAAARRAGSQPARMVTTPSVPTTPASVAGSKTDTS